MKREEFVYQAVLDGDIEIREDGSIWRVRTRKGSHGKGPHPCVPHRIEWKAPNGYFQITITRFNEAFYAAAHRLVYRHFFGPIPPGFTVNHKNGTKIDNHPRNLELATRKEQACHAIDVLKTRRRVPFGTDVKLTNTAVLEARSRWNKGEKKRDICKSLCQNFGVDYTTARRALLGLTWNHV